MRSLIWAIIFFTMLPLSSEAEAKKRSKHPLPSHHSGIPPLKGGDCPATHPIKGNFTTYNGERCIYHLPKQRLYLKTEAERCYASEAEAVRDGCRKAKI